MRRRAFGILIVASMVAACGRRPPLGSTLESPDALARAVLTAVERREDSRLKSLALTEREFKARIWPELPAARPERNLPFSYVWGDLRQKSERHLTQVLARYGGQRLDLVRVHYEGSTTTYRSFTVRRDTVLTVQNSSGETSDIRLFGSTLQTGGGYKVFSYVVDD